MGDLYAVGRQPMFALSARDKALAGAVLYFLLLRALMGFNASPFGDEAYYWMWGRHPDLSYFDHPPLQAWLQGLSHLIFGRSLFALRWLTFAALGSNLLVFYLVARRLTGEEWRPVFVRSTAVFLAAPLYGFFGGVAFLDYLLVALLMGSGYLFICYLADVEEHGRGRLAQLLGGAMLLGLAGLTKYNAAFLGLAVAGAIVTRPRLRSLMLRWDIYAAAAVAVLMQTPVLIWNLEHGLVSFQYQLGTRHGPTGFEQLSFEAMKQFAGEAMLMVSPFIVIPIISFFWARRQALFERVGKTIAIWAFWPSTLVCLYIVNFHAVLWWWNIVAFVLIFPFVGRYFTGPMLALHVAWGAAINTFLTVSYAIVPVLALFGVPQGMETERAYGWPAVSAEVVAAQEAYGADFLAANGFEVASQLGFALDNPEIVSLRDVHEAFDDWFDAEARRGEDAVLLIDASGDDRTWRGHFKTVTHLGTVEARHWAGYVLKSYELYLGQEFNPLSIALP